MLCLKKMASAIWEMTQHRDPGGSSFSSLPRPTIPRLSPHVCSPLCLPSAGAQSKWLQMNFAFWPFKRLSVSLAMSPWWTESTIVFHSLMVFGFLSQLWFSRLGSQAWGLDPTLLRGNPSPLEYPSGTLAATCGSLGGPFMPPHSLPVSLSMVIRLLSS